MSYNGKYAERDLDMDEVLALMKKDSKYIESDYNKQYELIPDPNSPVWKQGPSTKPNKRFLKNLLTDTTGHNVRLLQKEQAAAEILRDSVESGESPAAISAQRDSQDTRSKVSNQNDRQQMEPHSTELGESRSSGDSRSRNRGHTSTRHRKRSPSLETDPQHSRRSTSHHHRHRDRSRDKRYERSTSPHRKRSTHHLERHSHSRHDSHHRRHRDRGSSDEEHAHRSRRGEERDHRHDREYRRKDRHSSSRKGNSRRDEDSSREKERKKRLGTLGGSQDQQPSTKPANEPMVISKGMCLPNFPQPVTNSLGRGINNNSTDDMDKRFGADYDPKTDVDKTAGPFTAERAPQSQSRASAGTVDGGARERDEVQAIIWPTYSKGPREWDQGK